MICEREKFRADRVSGLPLGIDFQFALEVELKGELN